jgi:hypothetical protein
MSIGYVNASWTLKSDLVVGAAGAAFDALRIGVLAGNGTAPVEYFVDDLVAATAPVGCR